MMEYILAIIVSVLVAIGVFRKYRQSLAEKELNEAYHQKESKTKKVSEPKNDEVITYMTTLQELPLQYRYTGKYDSLSKAGKREGDIVFVEDDIYVYFCNKWHKLVDDMPHASLAKFLCYDRK